MFQNFTRISDRFLVFHSEVPKLEMKSEIRNELRYDDFLWNYERSKSESLFNLTCE